MDNEQCLGVMHGSGKPVVFPDFQAKQVFGNDFKDGQRYGDRDRNAAAFFHLKQQAAPGVGLENGIGDVISCCIRIDGQGRKQAFDRLAGQLFWYHIDHCGDVATAIPNAAIPVEN